MNEGKKPSDEHYHYNPYQQWRTQGCFSGGVSTNSIEDRENGDLGAVAP